MGRHFYLLDWLVLGAYFAATMGIGFHFHRRSRSTEGFTAGSRSLPGWACGLSIFATFLSSISFLAIPGGAYASNWSWFVFSLSLPVATWVAVRWFMPYYRRSGEVSAYAHLEHRFGPWARIYASVFYLLTQVARMGTVLYLMALALAMLLGWDIRAIILVVGASVTVYAFVGGIVAVIWTDALQAIVLMAGALLALGVLLLGMPEGPGQVFRIAAANGKFSLGGFDASLTDATFWVVLVYGVVINLQNFGIDQNYVQRYIASSSDREARRSVWLGGLLYIPVSAVFLLIGTALFAWYQVHPVDLAEVRHAVAEQKLMTAGASAGQVERAQRVKEIEAGLTTKDIGDKVFPYFIGKRLPPGLTGLLIAAILAAGMSTVSTSLNSSATLVMTDYYRRFMRPKASEAQSMRVLHGATVAWGVVGTAAALLMINIKGALDTWWALAGIFSGGMVGLFLLGLISRRAGNAAAAAGVALGLLVVAWMSLSQMDLWPKAWCHLRNPLHKYLVIVVGTAIILLAGLVVGLLIPRRRQAESGDRQCSDHAREG
ncbi:MAG: Sodium/glucose cotransporter [Planctomycetes bacterium ADurb.Bin126]|mgnify:CR=1 FL=1|nr:MAG: Sodium/glucose cotransporter [Planctomycetes bacterium ADurb.Bin126]HOD83786.1 sodium:solute symporter [Phycisphaerae bacterium]HOD84445.1 sodium:solute symporter [Phycisphaerae bacterium]HQL73640.1 sodium:solute symporter [Phycisphaerae bacterium]